MESNALIVAGYQQYYIDLVQTEDVINHLRKLLTSTKRILSGMSEQQGNYTYAEGKWTVKEIIGHMIDSERVFAYRAMCIARQEKKSLPEFEQDDYVNAADFNKRKMSDLINEYVTLRESNIALFKSFNEEELNRKGKIGAKKFSTLTMMYIIAGHEIHHINVIKTKYL